MARDDAFVFAYPSVLSGWRAAGAELSFFSPLADQAPDPAADAVYLPGGYPELHAGRLAASERFLGGLRRAAGERKTIYGECGGYMVLGETLTASDGGVHRMAACCRSRPASPSGGCISGIARRHCSPPARSGKRAQGSAATNFIMRRPCRKAKPRRSSRSPIPAAPISARPGCAAVP